MSRKTRQEKIIADLRRKLETARIKDENQSIGNEADLENGERETEKSSIRNHSQNMTKNLSLTSTAYIKKDLTKTFILTILAISLEIVLYFLLRVGKF